MVSLPANQASRRPSPQARLSTALRQLGKRLRRYIHRQAVSGCENWEEPALEKIVKEEHYVWLAVVKAEAAYEAMGLGRELLGHGRNAWQRLVNASRVEGDSRNPKAIRKWAYRLMMWAEIEAADWQKRQPAESGDFELGDGVQDRKRVPKVVAEIRFANYMTAYTRRNKRRPLNKQGPPLPSVRVIAKAIRCSTGRISGLDGYRAVRAEIQKQSPSVGRKRSLSLDNKAVDDKIVSDHKASVREIALNKLAGEQLRDQKKDERRARPARSRRR